MRTWIACLLLFVAGSLSAADCPCFPAGQTPATFTVTVAGLPVTVTQTSQCIWEGIRYVNGNPLRVMLWHATDFGNSAPGTGGGLFRSPSVAVWINGSGGNLPLGAQARSPGGPWTVICGVWGQVDVGP